MAHGHKTWVEIDAKALARNVATLRSLLSKKDEVNELCAVVKANAYGHDTATMTRLLLLEGVRIFGVDSIDEALIVRQQAPQAEIFILGYTVPERLSDVVKNNLIQTVYDVASVEELAKAAVELRLHARVNLKVETGTMRQGVRGRALGAVLDALRRASREVELSDVSSHLCESENADDPQFTMAQNREFETIVGDIEKAGFKVRYKHLACSAAVLMYPELHHTLSRVGGALYGHWPSESVRRTMRVRGVELKPVLALKSRLAQIKDVQSGESVGYGRAFVADRPMRIAVVPLGYYDGLRRSGAPGGFFLLHGQRCPIVGRICMNMCMIDVSAISRAAVGDIATVIGRDGMYEISADDWAGFYKTINYEVTTGINPLLPRLVV